MTATTPTTTTLVVGATGNTGKHLVQFLLDQGNHVKVVARSKERMMSLLSKDDSEYGDRLQITQAAILDLSEMQLEDLVRGCDAIVSCLGHNMTFQGMYAKATRRLVRDSVKRLTTTIEKSNTNCKFILMGSDGVGIPSDNRRSFAERCVLWLLRNLVPAHADNEEAAAYLLQLQANKSSVEWSVVRPTDLQDGPVTKYILHSRPQGSLFGSGIATRANVAAFMVELIGNKESWAKNKHQMTVLYDQETNEPKKSK